MPTDGRFPIPDLTPQKKKERTLAALLAQVTSLAVARPVLMLYEDLHWADPTTLELISLSIERFRELPVLAIATARPEFAPPWAGHAQVSLVQLSRLAR